MRDLRLVQDFGKIDAESDDILISCFEDHPAFDETMQGERTVVLGRKGTGKSAIFRKLLDSRNNTTFVLGQNFEGYPWSYHNAQGSQEVPAEQRFIQSWKYLILLSVCKILLGQDASVELMPGAQEHLEHLRGFVHDSFGAADVDVSRVFSPRSHVNLSALFQIGIPGFQAGGGLGITPVESLPVHYAAVNQALLGHVLPCLNPENTYIICFDQLDVGWEPSNIDYLLQIAGLLRAAWELNKEAKSHDRKLRVVVFLREDIFDELHFPDKNKLNDNCVVRMDWSAVGASGSLKALMEKRFSQVLGDPNIAMSWDDVFDESSKMTGRQSKYDHMIDRTFLRPRDLIKFTNLVLKTHKGLVNGNPAPHDKFTNQDIASAEQDFSQHLLNEIDEELRPHLSLYDKCIETLRGIGRAQFSKDDFNQEWAKRTSDLQGAAAGTETLSMLYDYSVIGFQRVGGAVHGSAYVFRYRNQQLHFDPQAKAFRVHLGLVKALGLRRPYGDVN